MPASHVTSVVISGGLGALGYLTATFLAHLGEAQCACQEHQYTIEAAELNCHVLGALV